MPGNLSTSELATLGVLGAVGLVMLIALIYLGWGLFEARSLVRREFSAYFLSPIAYTVLVVFLAVTGHLFAVLRQAYGANVRASIGGFTGPAPHPGNDGSSFIRNRENIEFASESFDGAEARSGAAGTRVAVAHGLAKIADARSLIKRQNLDAGRCSQGQGAENDAAAPGMLQDIGREFGCD